MLASIWAFSNRSKCWSRLVTVLIFFINPIIIERTSVRLVIFVLVFGRRDVRLERHRTLIFTHS